MIFRLVVIFKFGGLVIAGIHLSKPQIIWLVYLEEAVLSFVGIALINKLIVFLFFEFLELLNTLCSSKRTTTECLNN